jgi:4-amino-4-deoxy-L-arabinose transferase-like glycosyltransferase
VLVAAWLAVWVGFFTLAGTKLPSYVVPAYPALALFTGCVVDSWLREAGAISKAWTNAIWGTLALVGIGLIVALPIVAQRYLGGEWILGVLGLVPLAAAGAGIWFCRASRRRQAAWTIAVLGVVLGVVTFGFGAAYVDRYQTSAPIARAIAEATPRGERPAIGSYHYFRPSFVFYTGQRVAQFASPEAVGAFFEQHPRSAFVITSDTNAAKLAPALPADVVVLDTRPRFLQQGNLVVLGRRQGASNTATAPTTDRVSY